VRNETAAFNSVDKVFFHAIAPATHHRFARQAIEGRIDFNCRKLSAVILLELETLGASP
jgi:hypothetical protein